MSLPVPEMESLMERSHIEHEAKRRYGESNSYQANVASRIRRYHTFAFPPAFGMESGDQWPAHSSQNPDKIHVSENIIFAFCQVDARLQAIPPRITIPSQNLKPDDAQRAERTEQVALTWLELSGWDTWLDTHNFVRSLYGKGVLKPFWNDQDKRGDVYVIENIEDLRIGYGRSDFSTIDWALYESRMSVAEIRRQFPGVNITEDGERNGQKQFSVSWQPDHEDPLMQQSDTFSPAPYRMPSEYEQAMLAVWDYWWRDGETIMNCTLVNGVCVTECKPHPEMPAIPYIVIENDHEPGNPDGVSTAEPLLDLQAELNRLMTHAYQHVQDNVDPAWYAHGEGASNLEPTSIPKAGQLLDAGDVQIDPLVTGVNTMPFGDLIDRTWNAAHRISGLPEILFGDAPADISGRATAIQIQSAVNRIDPRRKRLYRGLADLLRFWMFMAVKKNPSFPMGVDEETGEERIGHLGDLVEGFNRWRLIAPEITPRDFQELTTNEINKVNARLSSKRTSMDAIGVESPEAEMDLIREERGDIENDPESVQQKVSAYLMMLQFQQTLQQMQMQMSELQSQAQTIGQQPPPGGPPGAGMSAQAQGAQANAQAQQAAFTAQPTALGEDQNQPATAPGSAPPGNGQGPEVQTLVRPTGVLTQTAFSQQLGG